MEEIKTAQATLKYARISSRKVKIVADLIRGKDVDEALAIVKFTPKASSEIIEKVCRWQKFCRLFSRRSKNS